MVPFKFTYDYEKLKLSEFFTIRLNQKDREIGDESRCYSPSFHFQAKIVKIESKQFQHISLEILKQDVDPFPVTSVIGYLGYLQPFYPKTQLTIETKAFIFYLVKL